MKRLPLGLAASVLFHAPLYGSAMAWMAYAHRHPEAMDIDLRGSSLILRPRNAGPLPPNVVPPQPWVLASGRHMAPQPLALTYTPQAQVEAVGEACPPPCPSKASDWLPAASAAQAPRLIGNFAEQEDIPKELRGVAGQVDVLWLVDAQGTVRDAKVLNSSDPRLTELVLKKLKQTRFQPGYDAAGNPIPTRFRMPISFDAY